MGLGEEVNQGDLERRDPLTGLADRTAFRSALAAEIDRAATEDSSLALVWLDVDHCQVFNALYGHSVGDRVLVAIADKLRALDRGGDTIARVGGDEFVLLLPGVDGDQAIAIAEKAHSLIAEVEPPPEAELDLETLAQIVVPAGIEPGSWTFSCSAGVAVTAGADARTSDLERDADGAMFGAKERGRGRTVIVPR